VPPTTTSSRTRCVKGKHQIFWLGWLADYPDAENFLFLLYGPNSRALGRREHSNYQNPEFDKLFRQLKSLDDGPRKQALIDKMVAMLQHDAPWCFGYFPGAPRRVPAVGAQRQAQHPDPRTTAKYYRLDSIPRTRARSAGEWNQPCTGRWPAGARLRCWLAGVWAGAQPRGASATRGRMPARLAASSGTGRRRELPCCRFILRRWATVC
jgi:hypothetical protein